MTGAATTDLRLLPLGEAVLLHTDPAAFTRLTGLEVAEGYLAFPEALPRIVEGLSTREPDPWGTYLLVDPAGPTVVGLGGFKGAPEDGAVEVGYSVAPSHRGRGHASAAVAAWVALAARAGVTTVAAQTLPATDASTAVLSRCGFSRVGDVHDEDIGTVWRWELDVTGPAQLSSPGDPRR